jgi:hypothetical protein
MELLDPWRLVRQICPDPADLCPKIGVPHSSALQEKQPSGMLESLGPLIGKSNSRTLQHSIGWWSNRRKELLPRNKKACATRAQKKSAWLWCHDSQTSMKSSRGSLTFYPFFWKFHNLLTYHSPVSNLPSLRKQDFALREQFGMCYRSKSSTPKTERSTVPVFDLESNHLKRFPAIVLNGNSRSRVTYVVHC